MAYAVTLLLTYIRTQVERSIRLNSANPSKKSVEILTMIRPSIRISFCSNSQIWMRAFCRKLGTNQFKLAISNPKRNGGNNNTRC